MYKSLTCDNCFQSMLPPTPIPHRHAQNWYQSKFVKNQKVRIFLIICLCKITKSQLKTSSKRVRRVDESLVEVNKESSKSMKVDLGLLTGQKNEWILMYLDLEKSCLKRIWRKVFSFLFILLRKIRSICHVMLVAESGLSQICSFGHIWTKF